MQEYFRTAPVGIVKRPEISEALVRILARHMGFIVQPVPDDGHCVFYATLFGSGYLTGPNCQNLSSGLVQNLMTCKLPWENGTPEYALFSNEVLHKLVPTLRESACANLVAICNTIPDFADLREEMDIPFGDTYGWDADSNYILDGFLTDDGGGLKVLRHGEGLQNWYQIHSEMGKSGIHTYISPSENAIIPNAN